jgi:hypothetical protein
MIFTVEKNNWRHKRDGGFACLSCPRGVKINNKANSYDAAKEC